MDEKLKMEIAKFRFGVISDFVTGVRHPHGERQRLIEEKTQRQWLIPGSPRSRISKATIMLWVNKYRASGNRLESLMPLEREDKGSHRALDLGIRLALTELRAKHPNATLPGLVVRMRESRILGPDETINSASAYRFLATLPQPESDAQDLDRRKFEAEYPNALWQTDVCHGPLVLTAPGKRRKSYLFAILDDHSRLVTHAQFYLSESVASLKEALQHALAARGKPQKLYVDNGPCYRSHSLEHICARLGIALVHARPYRPQGKGKIERFFRTIRGSLLSILEDSEHTLEELNGKLDMWVAQYNDREHSATGVSPLERYRKGLECVRPAPANLADYFREQASRHVRADRTVQLGGRLFEVPTGLIGRIVELHWHPESPDDVEVLFEKRSYGKAVLVNTAVNMKVGRASFTPRSKEGSQEPVPAPAVRSGELFVSRSLTPQEPDHELP